MARSTQFDEHAHEGREAFAARRRAEFPLLPEPEQVTRALAEIERTARVLKSMGEIQSFSARAQIAAMAENVNHLIRLARQ